MILSPTSFHKLPISRKWMGQRASMGDPLDGIAFALRFHTNDGVTTSGTEEIARVAGAEITEVNGDYWFDGGSWVSLTNHRITGNDLGGYYEWYIQDQYGTVFYSAIGGYEPPFGLVWTAYEGGEEIAPTVVAATSPIYTPLNVYQDAACSVPATDDGHVVMGWKDPINNKVLSWSNSLQCPILRFKFGYPVLEFGVGQRLYATGDALSAFSSKEKSEVWIGAQGTKSVTCLPLMVRTDGNAALITLYSRVGGRNYVYARRLAADSQAAANVAAASEDWFIYGGKFDWIGNSLVGFRNDVSSSPVLPSTEGGLTSATISPEIVLGSPSAFTGSVSSFMVLDDILDDVTQGLVLTSLLSRQPS